METRWGRGERLKQTGREGWRVREEKGHCGRRMRRLLEGEASWRTQKGSGRLWLWDLRCFCAETVQAAVRFPLPLKTGEQCPFSLRVLNILLCLRRVLRAEVALRRVCSRRSAVTSLCGLKMPACGSLDLLCQAREGETTSFLTL